MAMVVRTNSMALNANRQLGMNSKAVAKNVEKLSSGYKINRAGDDASGLAISEKMKAQIKGLDQASANSQDGISLVQTAEGAATQIHSMLNRMTELATKSANGTIQNEVDREAIQIEVNALNTEITRIAKATNFNGINLLDGSLGGGTASADGSSFTGSKIVSSQAAEAISQVLKAAKLDAIDTTDAAIDIIAIDGKKVSIDWTAAENKGLAAMMDKDRSAAGGTMTAEEGKDIAKKFQEVINNAAKKQGVSGTVTVKYDDTAGSFGFTSDNKGTDSEVSFMGTTTATGGAVAHAKTSVMNNVMNAAADVAAGKSAAVVNKATLTYNGPQVDVTDVFGMKINGVTLSVTNVAALPPIGATAGDALADVATSLQAAIRVTVGAYNAQLGLTGGTYDPASGKTGLTATDFTVEADQSGKLVVKYGGDLKDTSFSFGDVGDRKVASNLGLTGGSSTSGGNQGLTLQIGDTNDSFNKVTVSIDNLTSEGIGTNGLDVSNQVAAGDSIQTIKDAINQVSSNRANLGALQNRLEYTIENLDNTSENITSANSAIRDTDMAKEMMAYTKMNVLAQSAQAMLAQANQQPQSILQLLQ